MKSKKTGPAFGAAEQTLSPTHPHFQIAGLSELVPITINVLRCDDSELSITIYPFGV